MRPQVRSLLFGMLLAAVFWLLHQASGRMPASWPLLLPDSHGAWLEGGSFVAGTAAWWLLVERRRPMTRWNGTSAGAAAGASILVAMYMTQFVLSVIVGPEWKGAVIGYAIFLGGALALMAAGSGILVGGPVGFLYHLLACPRPKSPGG